MSRFSILGAGLMGQGISLALAQGGHQVVVYDPAAASLATLRGRVQKVLGRQKTDAALIQEILDQISVVSDLAGALYCSEIVVEAVPEQLKTKHGVLRSVEGMVSAQTPIWSNTSVLAITDIASPMRWPARLVGVHWWNPPDVMPLVEIAPGARTEPRFVLQADELISALGKTTVRLDRDVPGFVGNRLQFALVREALQLLEEGICDAETIDTVVRSSFGLRLAAVGPMENADYIGLDLTHSILSSLAPSLGDATDPLPHISRLLADGYRGAATGRGLLDWPPGRREEVAERLDAGVRRNLAAGQDDGDGIQATAPLGSRR